jgi:hypothetical protein
MHKEMEREKPLLLKMLWPRGSRTTASGHVPCTLHQKQGSIGAQPMQVRCTWPVVTCRPKGML